MKLWLLLKKLAIAYRRNLGIMDEWTSVTTDVRSSFFREIADKYKKAEKKTRKVEPTSTFNRDSTTTTQIDNNVLKLAIYISATLKKKNTKTNIHGIQCPQWNTSAKINQQHMHLG